MNKEQKISEAVVVFTAKSVERILREGGTSAWRLDRRHARQCDFAICTRNRNADWCEGTETHKSVFLVGKIRDVVPCSATPENDEADEDRFLILFSEYARVSIPEIWKGDRNPVRYSTLDELGIDPGTLNWEPMPGPSDAAAESLRNVQGVTQGRGLTMSEAKRGLALTFGVSPGSIEITIRG